MKTMAVKVRRCVAAASALGVEDTRRFVESHDGYIGMGMKPIEAARRAAADLLAEIHDEAAQIAELVNPLLPVAAPESVKEQPPEVSQEAAPSGPVKADELTAAERDRLLAEMGVRNQAKIVENAQQIADKTGDTRLLDQERAKLAKLAVAAPSEKTAVKARTPVQIAREIAKARPNDDVMQVREAARKAITDELGAQAISDMGQGTMMRTDDLTQAVHDGQYEAVREFAAKMPVPVHESDIPMEIAVRAHAGTSHSPEQRGAANQREYVRAMAGAWQRATAAAGDDAEAQARITEAMRYLVSGYRSRYLATLGARSHVMSTMIAGAGNFPVRANNKRSETADRRAIEASEFLKKGVSRMLKAASSPIDNSPTTELDSLQKRLAEREALQVKMKEANVALRKNDDAALTALGFSDGQIAELKKPDFAGRSGFPDYRLSNNNAEIRRLKARVKETSQRIAAAAEGPKERTFAGVKIEENATDDRIRLLFDGKTNEAVRTDLKANGFKWSPTNKAWQRQLTDNARRAAETVLTKHFQESAGDNGNPALYEDNQNAYTPSDASRSDLVPERVGESAGEPAAGSTGSAAAGRSDGAEPAAIGSVRRDGTPLRDRPRITALGIAADIKRAGSTDLIGRTVESADHLAELAQVYRDPRYETFRVFYTKGNEIVHATGVSARMPGHTPMIPAGVTEAQYMQQFADDMARTGADGYYVLHNHPSGNPTPSASDIAVTEYLSKSVPGLLAHVVINSNKYALIQPGGASTTTYKDFGPDMLLQASKPSPVLGRAIDSPDSLVVLGKSLQRPGWVTLVGVDSGNKTRVVVEAPSIVLTRPPAVLAAMVRRFMRQSGARYMSLVGSDGDVSSRPVQLAIKSGVLRDAVGETGRTQAERGTGKVADDFALTPGRNLAEPVTADSPEQRALKALSENDSLFALPRSDSTTVDGIAAKIDPEIKVRKITSIPGETRYDFTMPNGNHARMVVRPINPYGPSRYGFDYADGEASNVVDERPGDNPEDVPPKEDVWVDVSLLKSGSSGAAIYAIAANYAHNTGRIFIGDPAGLSNEAMVRRPEQMLSSALKFGTTEHLAPHPRQVTGDAKLGVPPLRWVYGDDLGNIRRLIDLNLAVQENAGTDEISFNPSDGQFHDSTGAVIDRAGIGLLAKEAGLGRGSLAGGRTLARSAVLRSLLRDEGSGGKGEVGGRDGLLARLAGIAGDAAAPTRGIFYSRDGVEARAPADRPAEILARAAQVKSLVERITARWKNAPEVIVVRSLDDENVPEAVRRYDESQRSDGAKGSIEGFFYKGKVYLIADQLGGDADVLRVLMHESLGHYGLRSVFGQQLGAILDRMAILQGGKVRDKARQYGLDFEKQKDRRAAAEEVLAEFAQRTPEIGWVQRAVAAIRTWLREHVPGYRSMKMSDAEIIRNFIIPARNFVKLGAAHGAGVAMPTQVSQANADATQSAVNARRMDSEYLANVLEGEAFREHGLRGLDVPTQRVVLSVVAGAIRDLKVRQGVVQLVPVGVVNDLAGKQGAPDVLLNDESVLKHIATIDSENAIPKRVDAADALVRATALVAAKEFGSGRQGGLSFARKAAMGAVEANSATSMSAETRIAAERATSRPDMIRGPVERDAAGGAGKIDGTQGATPSSSGLLGAGGVDASPVPPSVPAFSRSLGAALGKAAGSVRDVNLPAGYKVADLMDSAGKLSVWHKTVGSQYNLAQRSPEFKRVFDGVQNFLNDASYYTNEAANLAPNVLPKLEGWKDVFKSPLSAADTKAISAPIFEGTLTWARDAQGKAVRIDDLQAAADAMDSEQKARALFKGGHLSEQVLKMWQGLPIEQFEKIIGAKYERDMLKAGVVWTPAELKAQFNATGDLQPDGKWSGQIGLYNEFRAATDESLSNLAVSEMLNYAGKDANDVRAQALDLSHDDAAVLLRDHLFALAEADPARADALNETANKMIDIADHATDMQARGYAPLSRFGTYTLEATLPTGERYFSLFETTRERAKMQRTLAAAGATGIGAGTMSQEDYKLLNGVSPETVALFGEMLGFDSRGNEAKDLAFQTFIKKGIANRSAMKRLLKRQGIAGFSDDAGRVLAGFVYSNGRKTSSNLHMGEVSNAVNDMDKQSGELKDAAVRLAEYVKNPQEEAHGLRALLFAQYLGGSVASAMVNATQPFTVTFPYLSQFGGIQKAGARLAAALKVAGKATTGDPMLDKAIAKASEQGLLSPQEVHQLMAQAQGKAALKSGDGTVLGNAAAKGSNVLSKVALAWGKVFSVAEQFNRRVTFIAAWRTAIEQGIADPAGFAAEAVNQTQFISNKGNKAQWARGAIGGTLMTFRSYTTQYLELLQRMATAGEPGSPERAAGRKAALLAVAVLFLLGGADGLPFEANIEDLIDGFMQHLGYNFNSKVKKQEFFANLLGEDMGRFVNKGLSGLPGAPIDVSGRLGMGRLLPGTGLLLKKADHTSDLTELAGPVADLAKRAGQAAGSLVDGKLVDAATSISPVAARNVTKAFDMAKTGTYRDTKGRKVIDTTLPEAILKGVGFQPNSVARLQEAAGEVQQQVAMTKQRQSELTADFAQAVFERDLDKQAEVRAMLQRWNETNPESKIKINMAGVIQRVKAMREDKATRLAKTAPAGMRAEVRQRLEVAP